MPDVKTDTIFYVAVGGCVGSHLVDSKNLPTCADWGKGTRKIGQDSIIGQESVPNLSSFANTLKVDTTNVNKFLYNRRRSSLRLINRRRVSASRKTTMVKLYSVSDSPPTLAVRMALKYLDVNHEIVNIDFGNGEQAQPEFRKVIFCHLNEQLACPSFIK